MLKFIDTQLGKIWHIVLVGLCRATGRDNFFFAKSALVSALICANIYAILNLRPLPILMIAYVNFSFRNWWQPLIELQKAIEAGASALPLNRMNHPGICIARPMVTVVSIESSLFWSLDHTSILVTAYLALTTVAMYWVVDLQGRSKSPLRRALDWAKSIRINLATTPRPFPMPG